MKRTIIFLIIAMLIAGGVWWLSKSTKNLTPTSRITKEITITAKNFSFEPSGVSVQKGDRVRLIFKDAEGEHNLIVDKLGISLKKASPGDGDVTEFTADTVGTFEYYSSVGDDQAQGVRGMLSVLE